jgi:hypothetical protein
MAGSIGMLFRTSILHLLIASNTVLAWHQCFNEENHATGICPQGNHCCLVVNGSTKCISGKDESLGQCCNDTDTSTGCGAGFVCSSHPNKGKTCIRSVDDDQLPEILPRYRLCSLPDRALKEVYGLPTGSESTPAYLSNMGALNSDNAEDIAFQRRVETAFIVIHGSGRNADDYLCCAESAAQTVNDRLSNSTSKNTLIIAPWFLTPKDPIVNITNSSAEPLRWEENGPIEHTWRYGSDSISGNISSYQVTDDIIEVLVKDRIRFSSLKQIVVAGHSAGGQYAVRWSLLSNVVLGVSSARYIPIRVVVANPKSFCWLDARRMFNGTFRIPHEDALSICPTYNEWEWGFENSTKNDERDSLTSPYKDRAIRESGGLQSIVDRFPHRDVAYLSGELDTLHNGECEDKLQGPNRRTRSANFYQSLQEIHGRKVHHHVVVKGVHHDHCLMFNSPEGLQALFGTATNFENYSYVTFL